VSAPLPSQESRKKYAAAKEEREKMMVEFEEKLQGLDRDQQAKIDAFINQEQQILEDFEKSATAVRKAQDTVETLSKELATGGVAQLLLQFDGVKVGDGWPHHSP